MKIHIEAIPHGDQRYETLGDWWWAVDEWDEEILHIRVSQSGNWKHESLIALHEMVEALLCKDRGIAEEAITKFDIDYENKRPPGDESEPGDSPQAPYKREHFVATNIERQMAAALGVDWTGYNDETK